MMRNSHESVAEAATFSQIDVVAPTCGSGLQPGPSPVGGNGGCREDFRGLKARLCFSAQASATVRWSPTLRKVVSPSRAGLEVLEVHLGLSEAELTSVLGREFGFAFWEGR